MKLSRVPRIDWDIDAWLDRDHLSGQQPNGTTTNVTTTTTTTTKRHAIGWTDEK